MQHENITNKYTHIDNVVIIMSGSLLLCVAWSGLN